MFSCINNKIIDFAIFFYYSGGKIIYFLKNQVFLIFFSLYIWYFNHFTLGLFITIFLLSLFFIYFFSFSLFSPYIFFEKNIFFIFYTLNIYHSGLFIQFFMFLSLFFCNLFLVFFLYTLKKIIIRRVRKWYFTVAIVILFHSSATLKISLISFMFLSTHMIFTIYLLYISIDLLIYSYIFYSMSKNISIIPTH